jgi:membrane protease subunit HflK
MQVAESAFREAVGRSSMDFVLYEGREQIAASAQKIMQDILDKYGTGVAISRVNVQNAQPPEQVQAAFDDAVKAKQDQERQKNEGQAYYNDVVPRARGAAQRLIEEANGYRQRVVANAEGEASRFRSVLAEYARAPAITRERMYIETLQQVLTNATKVLVDARSNGNLLFLPLDRIMSMAGGDGSTIVKPMTPDAPAIADPSSAAGRSRDSLRARERESRP